MADIVRMSIEVDARDVEKAQRALDGVAEEARKAGREARVFGEKIDTAGDQTKKATKIVGSLRKAVGFLGVGIAGVGLFEFTRQIEQATTQMNNIESTMRVATGSAAEASKALGFIREESERLGLFFPAVAKQMAQFSAAARGTAITSEELRQIFTGISEASRAMGLTAPQAEGAMMALQQMMSKGKVSAEELRQQLGERMPGSIQIMAQALDVGTQELFKMMENGELLSDEVLPKFGREMERVFSAQAAVQADKISAAIARLQTAFFNLMAQGDLEGASDAINELADIISSESFQNNFDSLIQGLSNLAGVIAKNSDRLILFTKLFGAIGVGIAVKKIGMATAGLFSLSQAAASGAVGLRTLAGGVTLLSRALGFLAGPAGIIATVATAFAVFSSNSSEAEESTRRWKEEIGLLADETQRLRLQSLGRELDKLQPSLDKYISKSQAVAEAQRVLQERIERGVSDSVIGATKARIDILEAERDSLSPLVEKYGEVQGRLNELKAALQDYLDATSQTADGNEDLSASFKNLSSIDPVFAATRNLAEGLDKVNSISAELNLTQKEQDRLLRLVREEYDSNIESALGLKDTLEETVEAQEEFNGLLSSLDPKVSAAMEYAEGMKTVQSAIDKTGLSAEAAERAISLLEDRFQEALGGSGDAKKNMEDYQRIADEMGISSQREVDLLPPGARDGVAAANAELEKVQNNLDLLDQDPAIDNWNAALKRVGDTVRDDISNGLTDIIMQAEDAKDVFVDLANQIARTITQQQVADPLAEEITSFAVNAIPSMFGGGGGVAPSSHPRAAGNIQGSFANGGNVSSGIPAIVGERGPELFTPGQDGQITPNSAMGGGGDVTVNIINQSGEKLQSEQQNKRRGPNGEMTVDVMVKSSMERLDSQGQLDGIFNRHGAKRQGQF